MKERKKEKNVSLYLKYFQNPKMYLISKSSSNRCHLLQDMIQYIVFSPESIHHFVPGSSLTLILGILGTDTAYWISAISSWNVTTTTSK